jgi:hypothetical protein
MTESLMSEDLYTVVISKDYSEFYDKVNTLLKEGWLCQGGIFVDSYHGNYPYNKYYQAMIKPVEE